MMQIFGFYSHNLVGGVWGTRMSLLLFLLLRDVDIYLKIYIQVGFLFCYVSFLF